MPQTRSEQAVEKQTIQQLQSFCRGEMSAVETYSIAMPTAVVPRHSQALTRCLVSHQQRVDELSSLLAKLGGRVPESTGPWGTLVDTIEKTAAGIGIHAALKVLEEGEQHGMSDYFADVGRLDAPARAFVESKIIPEQVRTLIEVQELRRSIV